jgi:hypothetical protein
MSGRKYSKVTVRKASGDKEFFDAAKLKKSLLNAGADKNAIEEIVDEITGWIYEGVTTRKIYSRAHSLLRRKSRINALNYSLKQALFELGPTGYPFEHLVGEMFNKQGFETEVGQIIEGRCITHEIDVIATNINTQNLIECKYSPDQGKRISIQVPLYVHSRVDDIIQKRKEMPRFNGFDFSGWIVCNTRFSSDSIQYASCIGLELLGWDYPTGKGLKEILEQENIFPVTVLNYLTKKQKQYLLTNNIVTCSGLMRTKKILDTMGLSKKTYRNLIAELEKVCFAALNVKNTDQ